MKHTKLTQSNSAGFTIIELMIVLGIAALILAGVLIAVPALQRNQRNNNRRADISYVQAQLTAYQGSNQNELPTTAAQVASGVTSNVGESAYYAANNAWNTFTNNGAGTPAADLNDTDNPGWTLMPNTALTSPVVAVGVGGSATEYNLWVDDATTTANATNPGTGADPLPDAEHFDILIGYRCQIATLETPGANDTYPTGVNTFVNEDGRARDFAIVYRLEGEDVWRCQDNT